MPEMAAPTTCTRKPSGAFLRTQCLSTAISGSSTYAEEKSLSIEVAGLRDKKCGRFPYRKAGRTERRQARNEAYRNFRGAATSRSSAVAHRRTISSKRGSGWRRLPGSLRNAGETKTTAGRRGESEARNTGVPTVRADLRL